MTWKTATLNTLAVAVLCAGYVGFRFYQRNAASEEFRAKQKNPYEKPLPDIYKSENVEVLTFGINPRVIRRGETANLCWGVLNAKTVTAEPGLGELSRSMSRCMGVTPKQTTTYLLKAVGEKPGDEKTAQVKITVQ